MNRHGFNPQATDPSELIPRKRGTIKNSEDDPGVYTNRKVRYLSLEDAATASGMTTEQTRQVLDRYLQQGIVKRGHCLKCRHCLSFDWYALEELGQTFRCHRCSTQSSITFPSWKGGDEPPYYYDLAEVVLQAFRNHIEVPSRALAELAAESRSFHEMPNVEVHQDDENRIEIDLWALVDGKIVIGEAKSGDRIKKNAGQEQAWLNRLAKVTEAITADEVVFATSTTWREATRTRIENTFQNSPPPCDSSRTSSAPGDRSRNRPARTIEGTFVPASPVHRS